MSMTEQKFDSLCRLGKQKDVRVDLNIFPRYVEVRMFDYVGSRIFEEAFESVDQALTDALRHLRKIKNK